MAEKKKRKLNQYVTVHERDDKGKVVGDSRTFGPDDDLPDWAIKSITNPTVWADGDATSAGSSETGSGDGVPDGSIEKVLAWVQEDPATTADRIAAARQAEQAKGDKARSGLLTKLDELAAG